MLCVTVLAVQENIGGQHLVFSRDSSIRSFAHASRVACGVTAALFSFSCGSHEDPNLHKGNTLFNSGKYFEARLAYRIAVQRSPKLGEAYYKLGLTEEKLQNFRAAYQALNEAATLLPARDDIKASLGDLCVRVLSS